MNRHDFKNHVYSGGQLPVKKDNGETQLLKYSWERIACLITLYTLIRLVLNFNFVAADRISAI